VAVAAGLLADLALGEPPAAVHPLRGFGAVMAAIERGLWRDDRLSGTAYAATGVALSAAAGRAVRSAGVATFVAAGGRALGTEAARVAAALEAGDLAGARRLLPSLAGRDPEALDAKDLARAVVESVAENTVDAVVAPALWAVAAGAPGALAYRAANTLDAMVGHRSARYERFGWASARLDDVAGWVPARATALLVAAVRPGRAAEVAAAVLRDAPAHPSPNAGVAEAAFAAALGLRLGGTNRYRDRVEVRPPLGHGRPAEPSDIARAVRLSRHVTLALAAALAAPGALGAVTGRRRPGWGRG
jgi:adenosylcobinamide-phosphate synthase